MNFTLNNEEKSYLLGLARKSIRHYLESNEKIAAKEEEIPSEKLKENMGVFVTLHTKDNHELRGCIGYLEGVEPVYKAVINNSVNAAVNDPRFPPVTVNELDNIQIEISVLSKPEDLIFNSPEDLKEKIIPKKHGLILKKGSNQGTFLPQVWDQLPDKDTFLSHLCMKAGLSPNAWKEEKLEVSVYEVALFEG